MNRLNPGEVAAYEDNGFVVPEYRLSGDRVQQLKDALDRVIEANPHVRPEKLIGIHIRDRQAEGVTGDSAFLNIARDEKILDMVEQLIGPDIILWGCQAFCKPAKDGRKVSWHQDGHYWPIAPLATCTVWVAIDVSVVENGCLRVIPGSHRKKELYPHLKEDRKDMVLEQRLQNEYLNESSAVDVELEAGQMSLHDVYLIHGSNQNRSNRRRGGLAIRYMPGSSYFDRGPPPKKPPTGPRIDLSTRPFWLLRGRDLTGKNDLTIGH